MDRDSGTLDEALERLHTTGPERKDRLTNHAPMAVEALARRGHPDAVHGWLDRYRGKLTDPPRSYARVTDENWPGGGRRPAAAGGLGGVLPPQDGR